MGDRAETSSLIGELGKRIRLSTVYITGEVLTAGIALILLPLYTAYLTPAEYGAFALSMVIMSVSAIVFAFGLNGSVLKFYYDLEPDHLKTYLGSVWLIFMLIPGGFLLLIEFTGGSLFDRLFTQVSYDPYIRLALWGAFISVAFGTLPRQIFRASERARAFVAMNGLQFGVAAVLTIGLLAFFGKGVGGALWAQLLGASAAGVLGSLLIIKSVRFGVDASLVKKGFVYGLPLLPHFLGHWILGASDRVILERYVPLSEVGVYSVAYQIGSILLLFIVAGNNSIFPLFGRLDRENRAGVENINRIITYYSLVLMFIGLLLALFAREAVLLLAAPAFSGAWLLVPLIVLGYLFMGLYAPAMNIINLVKGDTRKVAVFTMGAALLNIALNFLFIPRYGMIAAAATTAVSYFFLGVLFLGYSQRSWPVPFEYRRLAIIFLAGAGAFMVGQLIPAGGLWSGLALKGLSLLVFPVLLFGAGFLDKKEWNGLQELRFRF